MTPQPTLKSFAQRLYDSVQPVADEDVNHGWALLLYCSALGSMFQIMEDYGRDQVVGSKLAPGWSQILDPSRAPTAALPWLGQFVGVHVTAGLSDEAMRLQVTGVGGWQRGTPAAMIAAAQATLTGTKSVTVIERNGSPYNITVITKTSETPNPAATRAALISQKVAGLTLDYVNIDGQIYYDLLNTNGLTYSNTFTIYANYQNLLLNNQQAGGGGGKTFGTGTFGTGNFGN